MIVKVPGINGLGKTNGCEKTGNEILKALNEIHSNESGKIINTRLFDLEEIHLDNSDVEYSGNLIYQNSKEIFDLRKEKTIFLGGDHSISYNIGKAFLDSCRKEGKEPCLIVFDAHVDLMPAMKEPTHEEWLRALIEYGFPSENILIVGARNIHQKEIEFLNKENISIIKMNTLLTDLENTCDSIMEFSRGKELYLSLDIDVVDSSFAPATGYPETGGLSSREFLYLIQRLNKIKNLKAVDIVEINSDKDKKFDNQTIKLGAKILSELV